MSFELGIELLTLFVAAVGPFLAYSFARRLSVSNNRHLWINGLRDDLADFIANADAMAIMAPKGSRKIADPDKFRETLTQAQVLRFRIRLRLVAGKPEHDRLIDAVESFLGGAQDEDDLRDRRRQEVVCSGEVLIQRVWKEVERGN